MIGSSRSGHSLGMVQVLPLAATEPAAVPLEERQRDLEQEIADLADVIKHLKSGDTPAGATAL